MLTEFEVRTTPTSAPLIANAACFAFQSVTDGYEPGDPIAYGATEEEAEAQLAEMLAVFADDPSPSAIDFERSTALIVEAA